MTGRRPFRGWRERRHEARHAFGKVGIRRHGDQLVLPQVHIPFGEVCEVRRFRHGGQYIGAAVR
jgi:hypothetical protein